MRLSTLETSAHLQQHKDGWSILSEPALGIGFLTSLECNVQITFKKKQQ